MPPVWFCSCCRGSTAVEEADPRHEVRIDPSLVHELQLRGKSTFIAWMSSCPELISCKEVDVSWGLEQDGLAGFLMIDWEGNMHLNMLHRPLPCWVRSHGRSPCLIKVIFFVCWRGDRTGHLFFPRVLHRLCVSASTSFNFMFPIVPSRHQLNVVSRRYQQYPDSTASYSIAHRLRIHSNWWNHVVPGNLNHLSELIRYNSYKNSVAQVRYLINMISGLVL